MLEELHVSNLALIEDAWLEFGPGMTVLTGETGAGKTALVGALQLLLGERGDSGAVRAGAAEALVEGRFSVADEELLVRRRVGADGRSKCAVDGEMATVSALAARVGPLVDLHGQHEHQALLAASTHVGYLDRWAGEAAATALAEYRLARAAAKDAAEALAAANERIALAAGNADALRFVLADIGRVDPKPGEDDELQARVPALQHAERLADAASVASAALRGDGGAGDRLANAAAALAKVSQIDPALDTLAARVDELIALAEDTGADLRAYRDAVDHDPAGLEALHARLAELSGLIRKYGPRLDDVIATRDRSARALAEADAGEDALAPLQAAVEETAARLLRAGEELQRVREECAPGFVEALGAAVSDLGMEGARFQVGFAPAQFAAWTADGPARVEFLYSAAAGQPARPLARIASGGELSRVMLALKGVLGEADSVGTLVFDEVDAGIGGATAHAVGRRLAALARTHQVVVVTHLAQVAAYADAQLVVSKRVDDDGATTTVLPVVGEERRAEIARMLGGSDSDAGLAHAQELLENAANERSAG